MLILLQLSLLSPCEFLEDEILKPVQILENVKILRISNENVEIVLVFQLLSFSR